MIPNGGDSSTISRLGWLDALRGWAALAVALHHASYIYLPSLQVWLLPRFDPGRYGVMVFFLVSGYIIPASLERRGSVRAFWIGRFFRIYPLLAVACLIGVLPYLLGVLGLRAGLEHYDPVTAVLAHMTMLQDLLGVPNAINVLWTLSYEMAFYLLIVALFVVGGHRRSAPVASGLVVTALLVGGLLPSTLLSRTAGTGPLVGMVALALVATIAAAVSDRPVLRVSGGVLGGLLALALVTVNSRVYAWEGMIMLAVMFAGTAIYRAEHGQISRRAAAATAALVLGGAIACATWNTETADQAWRVQLYWSIPLALSAATFGAAWLLRHRGFPRWTIALGTVSYSIYLLHPLLLMIAAQFLGASGREDLVGLLVFVAVLVAASWASHRWIEAPAQRVGRRVARRLVRPAQPPGEPAPQVLVP
ncbi:acyltransferase family protein [Actinomadura macra]|uniref:acyltransferase family protein n=1 Tax=Actinomadura macra TaxID=46164 RepID=UPI0008359BD5|nr:acyltransferase [Actinomadura macra]